MAPKGKKGGGRALTSAAGAAAGKRRGKAPQMQMPEDEDGGDAIDQFASQTERIDLRAGAGAGRADDDEDLNPGEALDLGVHSEEDEDDMDPGTC
jgi:hypothetical protein